MIKDVKKFWKDIEEFLVNIPPCVLWILLVISLCIPIPFNFLPIVIIVLFIYNNSSYYYKDINGYSWTEVDTVDDLIKAREVQKQ